MLHFDFDGYNHVIRLDKGQRFSEIFEEFVTKTNYEGAWVNIIGGTLEVELGFYDLNSKEYHWKKFSGLYEITGVSGTFTQGSDGKLMYHLHGTFADKNYQVIGGHVKDFVAAATVEIFVHRTYKPLKRKQDSATGLQVLDLPDET